MSAKLLKSAGRLSVFAAMGAVLVACATLGGGSTPEHKVHAIMGSLNGAHMKSASQELGEARSGARKVGEHARELQEPGVRLDDGDFLRFAKEMEDANSRLQDALADPPKFKDIPPALYAQVQSCASCHAKYRK